MAVEAAVIAIAVAGASSVGCCERTSTRSWPSPQAASASAATSAPVRAVVAANTSAMQREQAALRRRLAPAHLVLERQHPPERLGAGKPADHAGGGRLELEPEAQLPIEVRPPSRACPRRRRRPRQLGRQEAHHGEAERSVRALGRTAREAQRLAPCGRPPRACGPPPRPRRARAGSTGAGCSAPPASARRRNRTA